MSNETKLKTVSASLSPSESATDNSNWDKFKDKTSNLTLPISSTPKQLNLLLAKLLNNTESDFAFYINGFELATDLEKFLEREKISAEEQINIVFDQKEPLWVRPVTRCSSSLSGHENSILVVRFSPDSKSLATGAGDNTVRLWDLNTEMPRFKLEAHGGWVQALAWSPDSSLLSSGCYSGILCLWNPSNGELIQKFSAHSGAIMDISWRPYHLDENSDRFVSASQDGTLKIWRKGNKARLLTLSGHSAAATSVCWGGKDFIYSGSRDKTVRVWNSSDGALRSVLNGHSHWVNHISLSTGYAIRSSFYEKGESVDGENRKEISLKNYEKSLKSTNSNELLISASDDNSAFLWNPLHSKKPIARLFGHQSIISFVRFSPNAKFIATASFDKSVRLWNGADGKYLKTLRGHVAAVFQLCWSGDSRFLVTGSKDSTLKLWTCFGESANSKKRKRDLPGHEDEVYAVDWSPDGSKVASGGKDKILKLWTN